MNEHIKNKWNEMISNDDIVYIVGDFARRDFKNYVNSLNGKKIFIQGNHGYRARIRNHGHSCFLCEIVIRSQFHTTYEPEA
jgi:Predicted phosphohydrolase